MQTSALVTSENWQSGWRSPPDVSRVGLPRALRRRGRSPSSGHENVVLRLLVWSGWA